MITPPNDIGPPPPTLSYETPPGEFVHPRPPQKFWSDLISGLILGFLIPIAFLIFLVFILHFCTPVATWMVVAATAVATLVSLVLAVHMLIRYRWYGFLVGSAISTGYFVYALVAELS
jgi:hypothetical protein